MIVSYCNVLTLDGEQPRYKKIREEEMTDKMAVGQS